MEYNVKFFPTCVVVFPIQPEGKGTSCRKEDTAVKRQ